MRPAALLLLTAASIAAADDNPFAATEVAPGIYMLAGTGEEFVGGGVGLLVGDEYVVLIDDVIVPTAPKLLEKVQEIAGRPADFVINTHVHGDHVGGNQQAAESGAVIVAHDNLRKRMAADPNLNTGPGALPVITFADNVTFHVNGEEAFVFHVAEAHTDGDAVIHFRHANVIAAGDVSFRGLFPFIDLDSGGSVAGYKAAMQRIIDMADESTRIITGHGPLATRADLEKDLAMLVDAEARVKALVDQGLSADDIVAANPLAAYHDDYNWGFITTERMTRTLIRSLTTD